MLYSGGSLSYLPRIKLRRVIRAVRSTRAAVAVQERAKVLLCKKGTQ